MQAWLAESSTLTNSRVQAVNQLVALQNAGCNTHV